MHQLTRLFGPGFPKDLATGQPEIDAFLQHMDARLAGAAATRKGTLEEVRDHLLEAQATRTERGLSKQSAAQQAIEDFGDIEPHARLQRQSLYRRFWLTFLCTGGPFALLMAFFYLDHEVMGQDWQVVAGMFAFNFIFFGFFIAYLTVFSFAPGKEPQNAKAEPKADHEPIQVQSTTREKRYAVGMLVVMTGLGTMGVAGLFNVGFFASVSVFYCIGLAILAFHNALGMSSAWNRYQLTRTHLQLHSWFGRRDIPRHAITMVKRAPTWMSYLYVGAGVLHWVYWHERDGSQIKAKRIGLVLNQEMRNMDVLLTSLHDDALQAKPCGSI